MTKDLAALVEAALDQRNPTPDLKDSLRRVLTRTWHPARQKSDDVPGRIGRVK